MPAVVGSTAFGVRFNTLAPPGQDKEDDAEGRSMRSANADTLLHAVRTVFEVCGPGELDLPVRLLPSCSPAPNVCLPSTNATSYSSPHSFCTSQPLLWCVFHIPGAGGRSSLDVQRLAKLAVPTGGCSSA